MKNLIEFIQSKDGISGKAGLIKAVQEAFKLQKARSVYFCDQYAIRFSQAQSENLGNTILSLQTLQKYDDRPFMLCIVTPQKNYLLLINTTFLFKISHSSQALRTDNIRGSFNGSDIMRDYDGIKNAPENFDRLFDIHQGFSFQDNLERLVESTNQIEPTGKRFDVTEKNKKTILAAVDRASEFMQSAEFVDLRNDLERRVESVRDSIVQAASIDNVNERGRSIEYLITSNEKALKDELCRGLAAEQKKLSKIVVKDNLGDYSKKYPTYHVETDIKTKVMRLNSNPKAYNVDKLLAFLAQEKSVYMIFLVGITEQNKIITRFVSVFDKRLVSDTSVIKHWAGRNSRGVAQFTGKSLSEILTAAQPAQIDKDSAAAFLQSLINR